MARFNIEVAVALLGQSVRGIEAEFKKVGAAAERELAKISKSMEGIDKGVGSVKRAVKAAGTALAVDAIAKSLDSVTNGLAGAAYGFGPLNEGARQFTGHLVEMGAALRSFDAPRFAAELGQAMGELFARQEQWFESLITGSTEADRALERQRNLANILAHEGYDVVNKSLQQLEATYASLLAGTRGMELKIFGDPQALKAQADQVSKSVSEAISGKALNTKQVENLRGQVREVLDQYARFGQEVPSNLQETARTWGVVTTEVIKHREESKKATDQAIEAAKQAAKRRSAEFTGAVAGLGSGTIEEITQGITTAAERLNKAFGAEGFAGPDVDAYREVQSILEATVTPAERLARMQELLNYAVEKEWIDREKADAALRAQAVSLGLVKQQTDEIAKKWAEINTGFQESVGRALYDAADGFLKQMEEGLVSSLPKGVQPFAEQLLAAANAWLIQMLQNIVKAKLAAKGIGSGSGDSSGGSNWMSWFKTAKNWWSKLTGAGGAAGSAGAMSGATAGATAGTTTTGVGALGGGTAGAGAGTGTGAGASAGGWAGAAGGIAIAAITLGAILYNLNKAKQAEYGQKRETTATLGMQGGALMAGTSGRLGETGNAVAQGMLQLFQTLNETARAGVTSMDQVAIDISNNKQYFDAKVNGILIGKFTSVEEAMVKAVGRAFSTAEGDIDAVLRKSIQGFSGDSIENLTTAAGLIQEVADKFNFVSELDVAIAQVVPGAQALIEELKNLGVSAIDASVTGLRSMVVGFRGVWDSLSGGGLSQKEQQERAERSKALLLAQMNLERAKLSADIKILEAHAKLTAANFNLNSAEIRGETLYLQAQGKLFDAELDLAGAYLKGRGEFVKTEVALFNVELEAMKQVLAELDKLIGEVTIGKVKVGRVGGGRGRSGGGGGGAGASDTGSFWDLMLGERSTLSPEEQLRLAQQRYEQLRTAAQTGGQEAKAAFEDFAKRYIEEFQGFYGQTAPAAKLFEQVMRDIAKIGVGDDKEKAARAAAIRNIWDLADSANGAARVLAGLGLGGGGRRATHRGANAPGNQNNPLPFANPMAGLSPLLAQAVGFAQPGVGGGATDPTVARYLAGGAGTQRVVSALREGATATGEQLERLNRTVDRQNRRQRRARRGGGGNDVPAPPPPPTPPPIARTRVYQGPKILPD